MLGSRWTLRGISQASESPVLVLEVWAAAQECLQPQANAADSGPALKRTPRINTSNAVNIPEVVKWFCSSCQHTAPHPSTSTHQSRVVRALSRATVPASLKLGVESGLLCEPVRVAVRLSAVDIHSRRPFLL